MFLVKNVIYSIIRNFKRSILYTVISFLLIIFYGSYLANLWNNEQLLQNIGEKIPLTATITNLNGSQEVGLSIPSKYVDGLMSLDIKNPVLTAESYGNIDNKISLYMVGANTIEAFALDAENVETDRSLEFLANDNPFCLINSDYVLRNELELEIGSVVDINLFKAKYDSSGYTFDFIEVCPTQLTVVGFYSDTQSSGSIQAELPDIICPIKYLSLQYYNNQTSLEYSSAKCTIANPLLLNDFKIDVENLNFKQVDTQLGYTRHGSALYINDNLYIESVSQIMRSIKILNLFLLPVSLLLIMLIVLTSFFITRTRREQIFIAQCLGAKKRMLLTELVLENFLLSLIGVILSISTISFIFKLNLTICLLIAILFICFELLGSFISAIILMRVNLMKLLSQNE